MLTIVIRLIVITALVYAGVQYWYGNVEKRLQKQVPPPRMLQQPKAEAEAPSVVEKTSDDIPAILSRNIFQASKSGGTGDTAAPREPDIDQLAQTQLSLSLLGTVTGSKEDARAIVRDEKTKLEDIYRIGSEIQGAIIQRITRGKVVLLVNGREEVLVIKDREGGGRYAASASQQQRPSGVRNPDAGMIKPTPRAVPRRRISFRNPAPNPPVAASEEINETTEPEDPQTGGVAEQPSSPGEEMTSPESEQMTDSQGLESEPAVEEPQQ